MTQDEQDRIVGAYEDALRGRGMTLHQWASLYGPRVLVALTDLRYQRDLSRDAHQTFVRDVERGDAALRATATAWADAVEDAACTYRQRMTEAQHEWEVRAAMHRAQTLDALHAWLREPWPAAPAPAAPGGTIVPRRLSPAPCDQCGYNGPGYFQPDQHPCATAHHAAGPMGPAAPGGEGAG